jgi:hypothetical protein
MHKDASDWRGLTPSGTEGNSSGRRNENANVSIAGASPIEQARANYNRTSQITTEGMQQLGGTAAKWQEVVNTLVAQINNGGKLSDAQAAQLAEAMGKLQDAGVPPPSLSLTPANGGGFKQSNGRDEDGAPLSANDLMENQQIRTDALRGAQGNQRQLDLKLDDADRLRDTAKEVFYRNQDDWTSHPDINGAPLTGSEIRDARQRVLNGQPLDADVEARLDMIGAIVPNATNGTTDPNRLWDANYSPDVLRLVNSLIGIRNSFPQPGQPDGPSAPQGGAMKQP